ncbi:MAG: acetyl-CoA carboxylase biotin carboxyl carrier protein subunit, partial [Pseudonocardiaceae bacterium]
LLAEPDVVTGRLDTGLVERALPKLTTEDIPQDFFAAAALDRLISLSPTGSAVDPWSVPSGWRLGGGGGVIFLLRAGAVESEVRVEGTPADALVRVADGEPIRARAVRTATDDSELELRYQGMVMRYRRAVAADGTLWLAREGRCVPIGDRPRLVVSHGDAAAAGPVTSPMPGTVLVVKVERGAAVSAGDPLLVVEAMKMEHTITAPVDGVVSELHVKAGHKVALDEPLAVVTPAGTGDEEK